MKIEDFIDYSVPFNFDDKIEVSITRNGIEKIMQIEFVAFRVFAADKTQTNTTKFSIRYYDTQRNAYTQEELVKGFIRHIPEVLIPHNGNGHVCYCKECNYIRARDNGILLGQEEDLPF